jgi:hypothetical protein
MPTLPEIYVYNPDWSGSGVMRAWVDAGRGPSRLRVNKPRPYGGLTSGIDISGTRRDFDGMGYAYFSRKRLIRRRTLAYIAGVTLPVAVFCWLG